MNHAPIVPIVLPALVAALMLFDRNRSTQRALAWLSVLLQAGCAAWLLALAADDWRGVYLVGNWAAPWGIALVADRLATLMLALTAALATVALAAAHAGDHDRHGEHFHPLFQIQLMGLNGAFLTGDLFNLFVFFEVLLIASYGLLVHGDGPARVAAGLRFVSLNLVGSLFFLIGAGLMYGVTGTLNFADLSVRLPGLEGGDATLARIGAWMLLVVFCLKAAILPLSLWLPSTYSAATPPVAALFAVMTKVGIVAVLRLSIQVLGATGGGLGEPILPWLVAFGTAGYAAAALGALAGSDLRRTASMLLVASSSFLLIGVAGGNERSIAAALVYLPHTTLSAAALFLVAHLVASSRGPASDRLVGGPAPARPAALGAMFFASAIALAGLPPFSGFIAKAMLLGSTLPPTAGELPAAGPAAVVWAVVLVGSLFALVALARAGIVLFWESDDAAGAPGAASAHHGAHAHPEPAAPAPTARSEAHATGGATALPLRALLAPLAALAAVIALAIAAGPVQRFALEASRDLLDPAEGVDQVLRTAPRPGPHQPAPETMR